jgi:hypothetical protein
MTATIEEIKKVLIENPNISDGELMDKYGVNEMLTISVMAFMLAEKEQMSEEELNKIFPEHVKVKPRENFINWIVNALRSIWKLDRRR